MTPLDARREAGKSASSGRHLRLEAALALLFLAGAAAFALGVAGEDPLRTWQIFLVNFLFWSGIAQAGPVFAALLHVTDARWGRSVKRIAEATAAFLPLSFLCFLALYLGRSYVLPWVTDPIPAKQAWLNVPFLFAREGVGLILLYGLSAVFVYFSIYPDVAAVQGKGRVWPPNGMALAEAGRRLEKEVRRSQRVLGVLSPAILIVYGCVFTLLAFDFVMSLDRHWYSTLLGGYFFVGNLYVGLAFITTVAVVLRRTLRIESFITLDHLHDLGKLLLGFSMLWAYLLFSQYLIIWYGNLPEETGFVVVRVKTIPWVPLAWAVLFTCFVAPFVVLLSRRAKRTPPTLFAISCVILAGMWLERYVLVVPSLWHGPTVPLGLTEVLITGGFFAAFALSYLWFIRTFPVLPYTDPLFLGSASPRVERVEAQRSAAM